MRRLKWLVWMQITIIAVIAGTIIGSMLIESAPNEIMATAILLVFGIGGGFALSFHSETLLIAICLGVAGLWWSQVTLADLEKMIGIAWLLMVGIPLLGLGLAVKYAREHHLAIKWTLSAAVIQFVTIFWAIKCFLGQSLLSAIGVFVLGIIVLFKLPKCLTIKRLPLSGSENQPPME